MTSKEISRPTLIGLCVALIGLLGGLFWWKTSPQGNAQKYTEAVSKLEQSEALSKSVSQEEYLRKNPDAARAMHERYGDKEPQPEVTN